MAAAAFIEDTEPLSIARRLNHLAMHDLLAYRAAVVAEVPSEAGQSYGRWAVIGSDAESQHPIDQPLDEEGVISTALSAKRTVLVAPSVAGQDTHLAMLLPRGRHMTCVPFEVGELRGALVFEHRFGFWQRRNKRIERRTILTAEHATSLAAMSLSRTLLLSRLRRAAETDGLTGVANRRVFDLQLASCLARGTSDGALTGISLVDLDFFKRINDVHGHQMGDEVLRITAETLRAHSRPGDIVARYGGEEFAVIMPATSLEVAGAQAERLRLAIRDMNGAVPVTASIGVASGRAISPDALIAQADEALYKAKESGRNQVVLAVGSRPENDIVAA
ncbi:diguanylate cyclase [Actinoplanes sp. CA-030573]|uniref:GGDEF domain-containing protein n=1 Tax=Actinoplanes sp. CA-030573 TaxID=3239898 RepID=UPI003D8F5142